MPLPKNRQRHIRNEIEKKTPRGENGLNDLFIVGQHHVHHHPLFIYKYNTTPLLNPSNPK